MLVRGGRGALRTAPRERTFDGRWLAATAALGLALVAGILAHMRINATHADPAGLAAVGLLLAAAVATSVAMVLRDAALRWDLRREVAVARADAVAAERHADRCDAAELRSRQLLEALQMATADALRDPFLADRLTRDPRRERTLLALLDEIDEHLGHRPAAD
jgi:hypothetical protein